MNFDFSDEQKQMRDEARKFLSEQCPPKAVREVLDGKAPYDKSLWKGLAEMGFLGIAIPEQFGNHRAAVEAPEFAAETAEDFTVHTAWIENEFAERLSADDGYAADYLRAAELGRSRFSVDIDGRRVMLGVPKALAAALESGGQASSSGSAETDDDGAIKAGVGGTVLKWLVEEGAQVQAGDDAQHRALAAAAGA